jgi:hypothetical protein
MKRWLLLTPALLAGVVLMLVSRSVQADDAATQPASDTGSVTVTVNDSDGKPVSGAHVTITLPRKKKADAQAKGGGKTKALAKGDTGDDGTVTLDGIPPGDYSANARTDDGARGTKAVTIAAGETATVTVVVKAKKTDDTPTSQPSGGGGN